MPQFNFSFEFYFEYHPTRYEMWINFSTKYLPHLRITFRTDNIERDIEIRNIHEIVIKFMYIPSPLLENQM